MLNIRIKQDITFAGKCYPKDSLLSVIQEDENGALIEQSNFYIKKGLYDVISVPVFEHKDMGWKVYTKDSIYYIGEMGWQGVYYKDSEAWRTGEGICYIPEYGFENKQQNDCELFEFRAKSAVAQTAINNPYVLTKDFAEHAYTRQQIIDACDGDVEEAHNIFELVDWQCPESLYYEI